MDKTRTIRLVINARYPYSLVPMKWAFATTAAIVRSLQKDQFYRNQLESDLKLVALDHLDVGWYMKLEEWLPLLVDLFYYTALTGFGQRTLGEAYSSLVPVDTVQRKLFLKMRTGRVVWVILGVVLPYALKRTFKLTGQVRLAKLMELLNELKTIFFYFSGKFPSFTNKFLSIRYIFYPRRPPALDEDSLIYKGLAVALAIVSASKIKELLTESPTTPKNTTTLVSDHKCPVCLDPLVSSFANLKCGHVYCWHCITKWMYNEESPSRLMEGSCPVCRISCGPPDMIPLANL